MFKSREIQHEIPKQQSSFYISIQSLGCHHLALLSTCLYLLWCHTVIAHRCTCTGFNCVIVVTTLVCMRLNSDDILGVWRSLCSETWAWRQDKLGWCLSQRSTSRWVLRVFKHGCSNPVKFYLTLPRNRSFATYPSNPHDAITSIELLSIWPLWLCCHTFIVHILVLVPCSTVFLSRYNSSMHMIKSWWL